MCCCENKESTYWYKYSYYSNNLECNTLTYIDDFITTSDFQSWWLNFKEEDDKLESVVKL